MKTAKRILFGTMAALAMVGCSDDKISEGPDGPGGGSTNPSDGVYFSIDFDLPSAKQSRSETADPNPDGSSASNTGVEIGKDYENKIANAIVVLAEYPSNNFIAAASIVNAKDLVALSDDSYRVTSKFSKTELSNYYDQDHTDYLANIFLFCNPTEELKNLVFGIESDDKQNGIEAGADNWINSIANLNLTTQSIWTKNEFLMSNATIATREIPSTLDDWNYYTSESKPFDLSGYNGDVEIDNGTDTRGSIKVERAAARFDFRDGSKDGSGINDENGFNGIGDCTYEVVYTTDNEGKKTSIVNMKLEKMSFVNMNTKFYFLRHVSPTGTTANWKICEAEKAWKYQPNGNLIENSGNYVVDANLTWKQRIISESKDDRIPTEPKYAENFFYPFFNSSGTINNVGETDRWATSIISTVLAGENDNKETWNNSGAYNQYHIWRYASENTIAAPSESQINAISSGVVFKGRMIAPESAVNSTDEDIKKLAAAINNTGAVQTTDPILYLFAGNLYCGWESIREAAIKAAIPGFYWVKEEPDDPTSDKGRWEPISINRSNSLYVAVFGTGGFGSVKFKYNEVNEKTGEIVKEGVEVTYNDTDLAEDETSANSNYNKWNTNTPPRPASGTVTANFKKAVTDAKITIYQRAYDKDLKIGGYYCYYYYWNRHNDNHNNGVMGPMEFCVVRNNVYKLAVTKISQLGHPRLSENDPDKPTPGTPDEKGDVYLTVTAEVLPWVVRVNDIEF